MVDEYIFVKSIERPKDKNGQEYIKIVDHLNRLWYLFRINFNFEVNKCYELSYDLDEKGLPKVYKTKPLVNVFQAKALRETANINDIKRDLSMCLSYAKDLASNGVLDVGKITEKTLEFYTFIKDKSDEFYNATQNKT